MEAPQTKRETGGLPAVIDRWALLAAFCVALIATSGSLFYSLGLGLFPCRLCWYQRVLMYPQPLILGYALLTDFEDVPRLALPFSLLGLPISLYHSYIQLAPATECSFAGCAQIQFKLAGLLSIPNQAAIAFALLLILLTALWRQN